MACRPVVSIALVAVLAALAAPAAAEPRRGKQGKPSGFLQIGTGYRGIFPFDEEYCGEDDPSKSYCLSRSPVALDAGGGYGLTSALELIVTLSLGLESDFGASPSDGSGPHLVALAPGLRLELGEIGAGAFTSTVELPIDFSAYDQAGAVDLGVRNRNAVELPISPGLSGYAYFGETATWRRWFRFELELGLGVMVRR